MMQDVKKRGERGAQALMMTASLVLVVAGLKALKAIILPILLAVFLSILSAPLLSWLCRHRVPKPIAVVATVLANVSVMAVILLMIGTSVNAFARSIPRYQERIEERTHLALDWLEEKGIDTSEYSWLRQNLSEDLIAEDLLSEELLETLPELDGGRDEDPAATGAETEEGATLGGLLNLGSFAVGLIADTLRAIASVLAMTFLVFLLMIFILFEASGLPVRFKHAFGWDDASMARFASEIQRYLVIKTLISLATGLVVGIGLWLLGIDYALLWGLLAFLFNYIPTVGSIVASLPAVMLTLIDSGLGEAALVAVIFIVANVTFGNFLEPHLMGRQFGISTLVVILSLIFWGWMWGALGMLLSVPLTMIVKIMLENTEDFRWVAHLISGTPRSNPLVRGNLDLKDSGALVGRQA